MNWINILTPFALVASLLVFLQGWSILLRVTEETGKKEARKKEDRKEAGKEELKIIGVLTVLLATLGMIINILFLSTDIAISPEFGVFIIQGTWPIIFFASCLLGLILCVSLGWNLARLREDWESRGKLLYFSGFLVWCVSSAPILFTKVNTPGVNETAVYLYDIWWPPMLLWMTVGFTDIILTILRVEDLITRRFTVAVIAILAVFLIATYAMPLPDFAYLWTGRFWILIISILPIAMFFELIRPLKRSKTAPKAQSFVLKPLSDSFRHINRYQALRLGSLALIVFGLFVLFLSPSYVGPAPGIIIILIGWGWMTELITDGLFHTLYLDYKKGQWFNEGGPINKATVIARNGVKSTGERLGKIFSIPPNWTAIIKLLGIVVVLIILNEFQNRGKTIIQPFQAIGFEDKAATVDSVDDRLINELSILNQQLQPIIIFPTSSAIAKKKIDYVQAGNVSTSIDAALTNSGEFDLGSVKIPANVLVAPVQGLVRPWFNVRMVSGSIISNGDKYVLLVNASDGGTWISQPTDVQNSEINQAIPGLVEDVAFLILSSEGSLQKYGLTKDWQAFKSFQAGVENMQSYERNQDYDALADAIDNFRAAALKDPYFSLAYYRLGLALQQNRQPWQAENALSMGLSLNPESVPLKNALAYHLYFFDSYTPIYPAVMRPPERLSKDVKEDKKYQARRLWHQIVDLPNSQVLRADRASAYLGLCNDAMDDEVRKSDYLAYFYCFKSHTLLERLPQDQQSQDKVRQADASALNNLGVIIYGMGSSINKEFERWVCQVRDPNQARNNFSYHPAYVRAALGYYEKALALQPQDNVIRCNAAIAALLLGPDKQMQELEQSAQAHYVLGSQYLDQAKREPIDATSPSPYYKEALKEYKKAIDLNPTYHEALNVYAYAYWVFRLRWPEESLDALGIDPRDNLPEYFADKALRLAEMQKNDYLEVMYGRTNAEVLIADGDFQLAREILLGLKPKLADSYILDEFRWDLAQASLCLADEGETDSNKEEMEKEANTYLEEIQKHEEKLETYVFSYTGNRFLTEYRLPCSQFSSPQR